MSVSNGVLTGDGSTDGSKVHRIQKNFTITDSTEFIKVKIRNSQNANFSFVIWSDDSYTIYKYWSSSRFPLVANTDTVFILPLKAPTHTTGTNMNPDGITAGFDNTKITRIVIGITGATNSLNTITISELSSDIPKKVFAEILVPDNLSDTSIQIQSAIGSSYSIIGSYKLDSTYAAVGTPTSANWVLNDGTKFDDIFAAAPNGRALYPKSYASQTVNGSTGTIKYTTNKGVKYRIGLMVSLPPSDSGRTNINKIRLRIIIYYSSGNTTYEFSANYNHYTGIQNISKPLIGWTKTNGVEFYIFDRPFISLNIKDDNGNVNEVQIGTKKNTKIYHGFVSYANLTVDGNSDGIPDVIDAIEKMCKRKEPVCKSDVITFTTTGSTFAPVITVDDGATILWSFEDNTTSNLSNPNINFGTEATRNTTLVVTPWSALRTINVGYGGEDGGETPGSGSNLTLVSPQNVTGITNLQLAHNLTKLACSRNPIISLDLSNLTSLIKLESFAANTLSSLTLHNLPRLERLCVEGCSVSVLNLAAAPNLEDIRISLQVCMRVAVNWGTCGGSLWHVCCRDIDHLNPIPFNQFSVVEDLYCWYTCWYETNYGTNGAFSVVSTVIEEIKAHQNVFTSVSLPTTAPNLLYVGLFDNHLTQAMVDYVLEKVDGYGASNGYMDISQNAAPSASGTTHKNNLIARGWTVSVDS
jgi:hypothetical protein